MVCKKQFHTQYNVILADFCNYLSVSLKKLFSVESLLEVLGPVGFVKKTFGIKDTHITLFQTDGKSVNKMGLSVCLCVSVCPSDQN